MFNQESFNKMGFMKRSIGHSDVSQLMAILVNGLDLNQDVDWYYCMG